MAGIFMSHSNAGTPYLKEKIDISLSFRALARLANYPSSSYEVSIAIEVSCKYSKQPPFSASIFAAKCIGAFFFFQLDGLRIWIFANSGLFTQLLLSYFSETQIYFHSQNKSCKSA